MVVFGGGGVNSRGNVEGDMEVVGDLILVWRWLLGLGWILCDGKGGGNWRKCLMDEMGGDCDDRGTNLIKESRLTIFKTHFPYKFWYRSPSHR